MKYVFCNIPLKSFPAFLEGQISKDESTPLLAIKAYSFDVEGFQVFYK